MPLEQIYLHLPKNITFLFFCQENSSTPPHSTQLLCITTAIRIFYTSLQESTIMSIQLMRNMFTVRHTTYNLRVTHILTCTTLSKPRTLQPMDHTLLPIFPLSNRTIFPTNKGKVLLMILSDVCKISIRLVSFH